MGEKENTDELIEAQAHIWNHTFKYINSMSLKCVIELGVPDIIHNHGQPMSLSELVEALHIQPSKAHCLGVLMRLLHHSGFFSQTQHQNHQHQEVVKYGLTPSSRFLLSPNTTTSTTTTLQALPFVFLALHQAMMAPWETMSSWLRTADGSAFETVHGKSIWNYIADEPDLRNLFHQSVAYDSHLIGRIVTRPECRDVFEGVKSLVDVASDRGIIANAIAEAFPHITCTVLDLPQQTTKGLNLAIQIPPTDAVLLKSVLHQCNDEEGIQILKKCKDAISSAKGGKVVIIEAVLETQMEDEESTETELCGNALMMATFNNTKRNEREWKDLFMAAGFSNYKITTFLGLRSLIEVFP
ncbi:putative O-methyltransferase 3, partial [Cucurbita argyrosperma subsp. sororia]